MSLENPYHKQKKIATIILTSIFIFTVIISVTIGLTTGDQHKEKSKEVSTSKEAIQAICAPTEDQDACVHRLESHAHNASDAKDLITVVFKLALDQVKDATGESRVLFKAENDSKSKNALQGCKELMNKATRELKRIGNKWEESESLMDKHLLSNLKVWLSATITYQETCMEQFDNEELREKIEPALELTRNAIAIVSTMEDMDLGDILAKVEDLGHHRRLLYDKRLDYMKKRRRVLEAIDVDKAEPKFVVAQDGSGQFTTIKDVFENLPLRSDTPILVHIKEGVYAEIVHIKPEMSNIILVGDGSDRTKIVGSLNVVDGTPTWKTATFAVSGDYFMAKNIGFINTAGPTRHQAVALRVDGDMSVFYNCSIEGYESTLYVHAKRQFFRDCTITGTVDFVFGDAATVFQNCKFIIRNPLPGEKSCVVTAQGRNYIYQPTAIVIQNSTITPEPNFIVTNGAPKVYLGRLWREYSRIIIMESYIDKIIDPEGWEGKSGTDNCFHAEFQNTGPGADKSNRAKWRGIKDISWKEASKFTVEEFIDGEEMMKHVVVPYHSGLFSKESKGDSHSEKKNEHDDDVNHDNSQDDNGHDDSHDNSQDDSHDDDSEKESNDDNH